MTRQQAISKFLRALAEAVEKLDDNELNEMLRGSGLARLITSPRGLGRKAPGRDRIAGDVGAQALSLLEGLSAASTREEAHSYLENLHPTRQVLVQASELRDIHLLKQDTNAVIIQKLIANVVGSRLDSAAIRGQ